jgi:ferritin-like protein
MKDLTAQMNGAGRSTRRRRFLGLAGITAAGLAVLPATSQAMEEVARPGQPTRRDIAILRFLAAAELIETDLWQQYAELAVGNLGYREALEAIDDDLPVYTVDITEDELSHAEFINAYLRSIGAEPVDLDPFRTIPPPAVRGLRPVPRLTNLTALTIDTSYYTRYQSTRNPDFGATFPQIATIRDQPAIPTSNGLSDRALAGIARVAAFHFPSIEVTGTSLYDQFVPFVANRDVLRIVSSIYATEAIHYAIFRDSLGGVTAFRSGDGKLVVPDLTEGKHGSSHVMPKRCDFLDKRFPTCSVIRPSSQSKAGARAVATALTASHLFKGQPPAFFEALSGLARAADGLGA